MHTTPEIVQHSIHTIRGQRVMFDFDLATLYGVENRALKQAVRRNPERFPPDFMFQLTKAEWDHVVTNCDNLPQGVQFSPATPFAFTEQGVAMLSGILRSPKAVAVNIAIMRAFVAVRQLALANTELSDRLTQIEQRFEAHASDVSEAINYLLGKDQLQTEQATRKRIGFKRLDEE